MLKISKKHLIKKKIVSIITSGAALVLVLAGLLPAVFATSSWLEADTSGTVVLDQTNPGVVTVALKAKVASSIFGLQGSFADKDSENNRVVFDSIVTSDKASSMVVGGEFTDNTFVLGGGSVDFEAGETILTATYNVSADAPAGDYELPITIIAASFSGNDVENEEVSAIVTVERAKVEPTLNFEHSAMTVTYGDEVVNGFNGESGAITFSSSNPSVATVNAGSGEVTLVGEGTTRITVSSEEDANYLAGSNYYDLTVNKKEISVAGASVADKTFDGTSAAEISGISFSGLVGSDTLTINTDYTISGAYFENANVGVNKPVSFTINLIGAKANLYKFSSNIVSGLTASISAYSIESETANVSLAATEYSYDGAAKYPAVTILAGGVNGGVATLVLNQDYTVEYSEDTQNVGEKVAAITGMGNYAGSVVKGFEIAQRELSAANIVLDKTTYRYNGEQITPAVTVRIGSFAVSANEYDVVYGANTEIGEGTITVTAKEDKNIKGSAEATFTIAGKEVIEISGISGQDVVYTGQPVVLAGMLTVAPNERGVIVDNLTTVWYAEDGETVIERPTTVGSYKVAYAYADDDYEGSLIVPFNIVKADSTVPSVLTSEQRTQAGKTLNEVVINLSGFAWANSASVVTPGANVYAATYIKNGDSTNYNPVNVNVPVYGLSHINIETSVDGDGGTITASQTNILEGTIVTLTITPAQGYELTSVEIEPEVGYSLQDADSGEMEEEQESTNAKVLSFMAGAEDMTVVVKFEKNKYNLTITGTNVEVDPSGAIKVEYGDDKSITIAVNFGYELKSVLVNNVEKISEVEDGVITLTNITENTVVKVAAERITYETLEGDNQEYKVEAGGEATFRFDADYSLFEEGGKVYVDGELVDKENYTSKSGSTIITFKEDYLATLAGGTHTMTVLFNNGGLAVANFEVEALPVPDTGRFTAEASAAVAGAIILPAVVAAIMAVTALAKRAKAKKAL